jgi:hypothetical protein
MKAFSYTAVFPLIALLASGVRADPCVAKSPSDYVRADLKHAREQLKRALALKRNEPSAVELRRALDRLNAEIKEGTCIASSPAPSEIRPGKADATVQAAHPVSANRSYQDSASSLPIPQPATSSAVSPRTRYRAERAYALGRIDGPVMVTQQFSVAPPDQWKTVSGRRPKPSLAP